MQGTRRPLRRRKRAAAEEQQDEMDGRLGRAKKMMKRGEKLGGLPADGEPPKKRARRKMRKTSPTAVLAVVVANLPYLQLLPFSSGAGSGTGRSERASARRRPARPPARGAAVMRRGGFAFFARSSPPLPLRFLLKARALVPSRSRPEWQEPSMGGRFAGEWWSVQRRWRWLQKILHRGAGLALTFVLGNAWTSC
jgi:hypothetical protein